LLGWFAQAWDGLEEDHWTEAFSERLVLHGFMFEEPAAANLAVEEVCVDYRDDLEGAPFGDCVE
jgi:hypothetical protein